MTSKTFRGLTGNEDVYTTPILTDPIFAHVLRFKSRSYISYAKTNGINPHISQETFIWSNATGCSWSNEVSE